MGYIFHEDFLLQNKTARKLYHDYAEQMPIIDYHCHLSPQTIADNPHFLNLTDAWLRGDHYKWRALRAAGVAERYITGDASDEEKFRKWAATVPYTLRNPLYHWTHLELKNPFGVRELLDEKSADAVYARCNALLQQPEYTPRGLLQGFKVSVVVTTDDPCDDLSAHRKIAADDFAVKVYPCFRPDKALQLNGGGGFRSWIGRLAAAAGVEIKDLATLLEALQKRVDYFHDHGGRLADHGLSAIPLYEDEKHGEMEKAFRQVLQGDDTGAAAQEETYAGYVLYELGRMYHAKGWAQQFHLGALRNTNSRALRTIGPDTGFDSIGDYTQAYPLYRLFDRLDSSDQLCKTILYNLNPAYNEVFATMAGNYNDGRIKGKMQFGSGWWYLDQKDGMEKQLNALSNMGLLSCFVGMLTDSRSFLSYPRHEYFRRILCNLLGSDVEQGLVPDDTAWLGGMVQDICYHNARNYFGWE